jgi:hypothetical protein
MHSKRYEYTKLYSESQKNSLIDKINWHLSAYKKKYTVTTNGDHKKLIYDNGLKQDFEAQQPNQA